MPELNKMNIAVEANDGTLFEYAAGVYVTKEGAFRVDLDERLADIAEKMPRIGTGVTIDYVARNKNWKVSGKALGYVATFIRDCAKEYLTCETEIHRVIVYGHNLEVAVWLGKDGKLYPNGCDHDGKWFKTDVSSNRGVSFYSVGLGAAVYDKTVYKRKTGATVTWEYVRKSDDPVIKDLNSFTGININPERDDYQQMPYTPEAAAFFYRMMLGLCRLAVEMDSFFGDKERLQLAISQGRMLEYRAEARMITP